MRKNKFAAGLLTGVALASGTVAVLKLKIFGKSTVEKGNSRTARLNSYYTVLSQWLVNRNQDKMIPEYLKKNNINSVAIYGMGTLGELLYQELKESGVKVTYFVDKKANELYYGIDDLPVIGIEEMAGNEKVDAVIVTPVFDYDTVSEKIENVGADVNLMSLEDIIFDM